MQIDLQLRSDVLKNSSADFSRAVRAFGEGIILVNRMHLEDHPETPKLYESGVRYQNEKEELGLDIPSILKKKGSDCLNLCCWRVAELRQAGQKNARLRIIWKENPNGFRLFHVQVRHANGKIEDPSRLLGMGKI